MASTAVQLQDHLAKMRSGEPVMPLVGMQAVMQAERLRATGMTYGGVAKAMAFYHGVLKSPAAWKNQVRRNGTLYQVRP